ncbi:translocation/assembly module TamB domain-containing protein [Puia sp. P3]|uniref:translocation/assembly module TamB domain-containing protein n=1 Tax=Puia sp. P3 TaxID=3423952 RepID=UPI003D66CD58
MKNLGPDKKGSNLLVNLDMYANNYANVYMILDPISGDIIKANGHGNLTMTVGTSEDLRLNGRYEIDRGSYNFTFQSFIHKPFILSEGVGNYIQWTGNPYDADIGIEAVYKADNIRFSDTGVANGGSSFFSNPNLNRQRVTILVTANLAGKLVSPRITFHIDQAQNSPLKDDLTAQSLMQLIQNDPNELNKQVSTLVVFNTFVPLSSSANNFDPSTATANVVVNSISGAVSTGVSRLLQSRLRRAFKDNSIQVNFNTNLYSGVADATGVADQSRLAYDRTNFNFSIAKSFMNEKLTLVVGSALDFGMTAQQAAASSFQFLPDVAAEYKITPDGRVALTFFYRDSYNYISTGNHTQNSSGASISYRRDFDRIDEIFKKKKKKKPATIPAPPQDTTGSK